jgi:hypothetical protein
MSTPLPIPPAIAQIVPDGNLTARQRRHFVLQRLMRRARAGTGSAQEFLRRRTAVNPWPDLRQVLKDIPWAIVGGVATRAYMPERMTKDMDVLVRRSDGSEVIQRLRQAGFHVESSLAMPGYLLHSPDGAELDVLFGDEPWLDEALSRPEADAAGYPVIGLRYLVLLKLQAARSQDWVDVSRMLCQATDERLDEVRQFVTRYSPQDVEDVEALIFLGKKEMEPPTSEAGATE